MRESRAAEETTPSVLVGIPAYNESATIRTVATRARQYADEVLVVDDGSDDDTGEQARAAATALITHDENRGYGAALDTIFRYASQRGVEHLVILDADGQHDVDDIPDLVRVQQESGAEIVTGSRFNEAATNIPAYRRFGLSVINLLTNLALSIGYSYPSISDTQCGFRVYNREAITELANTTEIGNGMGASLDILFQAAREQYDIVEVPTEIDYDVASANSQNPVVHGLSLVTALLLFVSRDRPFRVASSVVTIVFVGVGSTLLLRTLETTAAYVFVPALVALVLLAGVALFDRTVIRSGRTER